MRVHFLASTLVRGGAETMAVALSRRLAGRGHRVRWTLLREPGTLGEGLCTEMDLAAGTGSGPAGVVRLRARLAGDEALYALDHRNAVVLGSLAAPAAGVRQRAVAVHTTGLWGGRPSLGRVFRWALHAYSTVLALSPVHAAYLTETERVPAAKLRIVPNGIDLAPFASLPSRAAARQRLEIPAQAEVLGAVAMLRPEKNHALLLEAAADLRQTGRDPWVVLVGDGPERERLAALAARSGLAERVRFLGMRSDVPDLLPAFDVFVLPSHPAVETQPVAVIEALAAGIPVVATRVGDVAGLLEEGRSGLLVPAGDRGELAAAIRSLLEGAKLRETLVRRGRTRAATMSLDAAAARLEAVLEGKAA
jgi:glycosyltransferase involved in cell wall biosynthesis